PARMPIGPPRSPIAPPTSAPRPAPQSFDSTNLTLPSAVTRRTAVFPTLSGNAPATAPPARVPPSGVGNAAATIFRSCALISPPRPGVPVTLPSRDGDHAARSRRRVRPLRGRGDRVAPEGSADVHVERRRRRRAGAARGPTAARPLSRRAAHE